MNHAKQRSRNIHDRWVPRRVFLFVLYTIIFILGGWVSVLVPDWMGDRVPTCARLYAQTLESPLPNLETFITADIDKDQEKEIIYGTKAGCVHVLNKENGAYQETWTSILLKAPIISLVVDDVDGDLERELVVGTAKGYVVVYGTENFSKKWDNQFDDFTALNGLFVADIDGNGRKEIVMYNPTNICIYEAGSYFKKWKSPDGLGAQKVVLGHVDQSGGKELVTNTGYVIDPEFYRTTWQYAPGFGDDIWLFDVDSDGYEELIGTQNRKEITIFDIHLKSARIR